MDIGLPIRLVTASQKWTQYRHYGLAALKQALPGIPAAVKRECRCRGRRGVGMLRELEQTTAKGLELQVLTAPLLFWGNQHSGCLGLRHDMRNVPMPICEGKGV